VAVIAYNDAFVMNAWSKANGIKNDDIVCPPSPFPFSDVLGGVLSDGMVDDG